MQKFFAITKSDNSYIVDADTREELEKKIDEIREKYSAYYRKHIEPGYYIVQARNIKEAKAGKQHVTFDLPLFKNTQKEWVNWKPFNRGLNYGFSNN